MAVSKTIVATLKEQASRNAKSALDKIAAITEAAEEAKAELKEEARDEAIQKVGEKIAELKAIAKDFPYLVQTEIRKAFKDDGASEPRAKRGSLKPTQEEIHLVLGKLDKKFGKPLGAIAAETLIVKPKVKKILDQLVDKDDARKEGERSKSIYFAK